VGGVSGEPTRANGHSRVTCSSRNGGRHPGSRDAVSLRGRTEECESWPVRLVWLGLVPRQANAPATTGVLWENEEGNVVSVRQAHALFAGDAEQAPLRTRTRPSLGPETRARQSSLDSFPRGASRSQLPNRRRKSSGRELEVDGESRRLEGGGALALVSRSGKPTQVGGTGTGISAHGRLRGSPRVTAARAAFGNERGQSRSCVTRKKRKVVMATVPARKRESRAQCPHVVFSCRSRQAAFWLRISSYAAPQKR